MLFTNACFKGIEELVKQAFLHVDIIGPHDLVEPDGEIVLAQVWETMVQPDWAITMHMWPTPEPPKSPPDPHTPLMANPPSPPQSSPLPVAGTTTSKTTGDIEENCSLPVS
jgi:hypothetical protein